MGHYHFIYSPFRNHSFGLNTVLEVLWGQIWTREWGSAALSCSWYWKGKRNNFLQSWCWKTPTNIEKSYLYFIFSRSKFVMTSPTHHKRKSEHRLQNATWKDVLLWTVWWSGNSDGKTFECPVTGVCLLEPFQTQTPSHVHRAVAFYSKPIYQTGFKIHSKKIIMIYIFVSDNFKKKR